MKAAPPDFRDPHFLRRQVWALLAFDEAPPLRPVSAAAALQRCWRLARAARQFPQHPKADAWRAEVQRSLAAVPAVEDDHLLPLALRAQATAAALGLGDVEVAWQTALARGPLAPDAPLLATGSVVQPLAWLQALSELQGLPAAAAAARGLAARLADLAPQGLLWDPWTAAGQPRTDAPGAGFHPGLALRLARLLLTVQDPVEGADAAPRDAALKAEHQARELFAASLLRAWDRSQDGLHACIGVEGPPDHLLTPIEHDAQNPAHDARFTVCDPLRPTWVQAQAIAAAATLAARTLEGGYWDWYDRVWSFAWDQLRDETVEGRWRPAPGLPADDGDGQVMSTMLGACLAGLQALELLPRMGY